MRTGYRIGSGLLFCAALLVGGAAKADQPKGKKGEAPAARVPDENRKKVFEMMQQMMTPDEHHKLLTSHAGTWSSKATFYMGPQPIEGTGTSEVTAINNGLFTEEKHTGTFMGMPFSGRGLLGYDKLRGKYVWTWCDSMGSWMIFGNDGTADASGKVITWNVTEPNPEEGPTATMQAKYVMNFESDAKYSFTGYHTVGGKETKVMEIVYTRAK